MGRPLRKDRLEEMKLTAETRTGSVVLGKQVGYNKYVVDMEKFISNALFVDRGIVCLTDELKKDTDALLRLSVNGIEEPVLKITKTAFSTINGVYDYDITSEGIKFKDANVRLINQPIVEEPALPVLPNEPTIEEPTEEEGEF